MKEEVTSYDVLAVMRTFCELNRGDEASKDLILSIGAELLGISVHRMCDLVEICNKEIEETRKKEEKSYGEEFVANHYFV